MVDLVDPFAPNLPRNHRLARQLEILDGRLGVVGTSAAEIQSLWVFTRGYDVLHVSYRIKHWEGFLELVQTMSGTSRLLFFFVGGGFESHTDEDFG